jgi:hypothetical protein
VLLEWETDSQGYTVTALDANGVSDEQLDKRINAYLIEHPLSSTKTVQENVKGKDARIRARLKASFDFLEGDHGAHLWLPNPDLGVDDETLDDVDVVEGDRG